MLLLVSALIFSIADKDNFLNTVNAANTWILNHFDYAFSYTSFLMVILCVTIYFSPLGNIKIGGIDAKPMLNKYRWFSIILCTTIAVGILFWGSAEPLYHLSSPPNSLPTGTNLVGFSMSTMYMHWSFTPYAIYTIPALLFALGYYNMKHKFSLSTMLFPIAKSNNRWWSVPLDNICLFALVAGMSASLGAGMLSISGGVQKLSGLPTSSILTGVIAIAIVLSFTISAATGLLKGIRVLSSINVAIFILLVVLVIIFGPTTELPGYLLLGLKDYIVNFIPHSLSLGSFSDKEWTHSWTTFYWANWMAWAPVSALFLGRIAYGYTVRQFIVFNWFVPALFGILWMTVFSGTSIYQELNCGNILGNTLQEQGPESVMYNIVNKFPFTGLFIIIFLITMFISYVTAADSNTEAMSGISTEGLSPESPNPPNYIKYLWGLLIGAVAFIMVSSSGIEGVKMLSNLGGLPALCLLMFCCLSMITLLFKTKQLK